VVGTPIGNLGDITYRAVETLRHVTRIATEDTRRTRALLSHLGISGKPLDIIEAHRSERMLDAVVDHLLAGDSAALVTDAGMPSISDPGALLVRKASSQGVPVRVVPGPSAVTAAVAASGLVDGGFWFVGFLPKRGGRRAQLIQRIAESTEPAVLFESPHRIEATLAELARIMPERAATVSRELTKLHEETARGTLQALSERGTYRGEICIVVGANRPANTCVDEGTLEGWIIEGLREGTPTKTLAGLLGPRSGLPRRQVYARIEQIRARRNG
jgi:16S rRNA (cytidine1402-2'-O)-methyltransferase